MSRRAAGRVAPGGRTAVREASTADAGAVADLVQRAYRGEESRTGWTTEADLLDGQRVDAPMVRDLVEAPGSVVVVVEHDGGLLACCHVQHRPDHTAVGMIAVRPGRQGAGLGRRLLEEAAALARAHGSARLRLSVINHRSELIAWYERRGFRLTGDQEPFPYGDVRYGLPRRDDLVLLVMERDLSLP